MDLLRDRKFVIPTVSGLLLGILGLVISWFVIGHRSGQEIAGMWMLFGVVGIGLGMFFTIRKWGW